LGAGLRSIIKPKKKLKVVLDAGNGTASTVAPKLFNKLGAEVIPLFCELDGRFPNHHPDPTVPKNLAKLVENTGSQGLGYFLVSNVNRFEIIPSALSTHLYVTLPGCSFCQPSLGYILYESTSPPKVTF
jgi:hypothetical protein